MTEALNADRDARAESGGASANGGAIAIGGGAGDGGITRDGSGERHGVTQIPASIVRAICQIMVTVEAVKKSQRNAHGGYQYASTDDIYAAVTRKMGEVGLVCISLEDRCEIKRVVAGDKTSQWAHLEFSFVLATEDATWTDPRARRTLYIQVTGPQTFQAAQSYAEKAYLRSLLKLPTGDMDLDSMPQADSEEDQAALASNGKTPRKSSSSAKKDGTDKTFNDIRASIQSAVNREHLAHIRATYADEWASMPSRWEQLLEDEYQLRMDQFHANGAH